MNKKLILAGAAAVVGFFALTAFDGKTLEQQKAEIAQMVTAKLDAYRSELTANCDARVEAEAQTRYAAVVAAREEEAAKAAKPGAKPTKKRYKRHNCQAAATCQSTRQTSRRCCKRSYAGRIG